MGFEPVMSDPVDGGYGAAQIQGNAVRLLMLQRALNSPSRFHQL
jgi:hypothetical protein